MPADVIRVRVCVKAHRQRAAATLPGPTGREHLHGVAFPAAQAECLRRGERRQQRAWPAMHQGDPPVLPPGQWAVMQHDRISESLPTPCSELGPNLGAGRAIPAQSSPSRDTACVGRIVHMAIIEAGRLSGYGLGRSVDGASNT